MLPSASNTAPSGVEVGAAEVQVDGRLPYGKPSASDRGWRQTTCSSVSVQQA
jgi:hypothetical protein